MQETLTSFHVSSSSTSSSGRLDNLCANTSSLLPPSKPVREVTREYIRSGQSVESSSTSSSLQKDISWNQRRRRSPSTESTEALPGDLPVSDSIRRQPIITSPSNNNNNTKWEASLLLRAQPSTQTRSSSDATSLVISKPVIHAPNMFFGKSQTKKSLLDEEEDKHGALWAHSIQFMSNDADGNVSDLEDEDDEPILITNDSNRWSNSSNNILDRILSSSEFSMPSKPQRRVSVAHKV